MKVAKKQEKVVHEAAKKARAIMRYRACNLNEQLHRKLNILVGDSVVFQSLTLLTAERR